MIVRAYAEAYLDDVVENQGKLFDLVAQQYPDKDTEEFINTYMASKTRKSIDEAKAYVSTMDAKALWAYFTETENYRLKEGKALEGFMPVGSEHFMPITSGFMICLVRNWSRRFLCPF